MFSPLHSATNGRTIREAPPQSIQSPQEIWTLPYYKRREAMHCATANRHFGNSAKEDKGKSMMHALYVLRYTKGMSQDEATSNSDKIKPITLAVIEFRLPA